MVKAFKTDKNETVYAVTGTNVYEEIMKQLAAHKKESLEKVEKKFKRLQNGYFIQNGSVIELYTGKVRKGGTRCMIVRR